MAASGAAPIHLRHRDPTSRFATRTGLTMTIASGRARGPGSAASILRVGALAIVAFEIAIPAARPRGVSADFRGDLLAARRRSWHSASLPLFVTALSPRAMPIGSAITLLIFASIMAATRGLR